MSLAAIIDAMIASGCTGEQIGAAVKAVEAERDREVAERRLKAAEKKRRQRAKSAPVSDVVPVCPGDIGGQEGTEGDENTPPKNVPHTPYKITPLTTSLRSDTSASAAIVWFEQFWTIYPRKTEKKSAATKFFALLKSGVDPEAIIAGAQRYADSKPEPKFTKHPTTWLNRGCWDDEQLPRDGPKHERGSFMAYAASGDWKRDLENEQRTSEHHTGTAPSSAKPTLFGFDSDVPEPAGNDSGGPLLDLRRSDAGWY